MESKRIIRSSVPAGDLEKKSDTDSLVRSIESDVDLEQKETMKFNSHVILGVYVVVIALGITTGYFLSKSSVVTGVASSSKTAVAESGNAVGSTDTKTFKDTASGVIEMGGLNGEGTHKLIRDGGPSQTAYLISSVVDLDEYVGKKVTVWGQTMGAKKVSWLMDVGKLEAISE